jgi:hypothetical protein
MHGYARLINSTVAFVAALFLAITLHEFAHGLAALALGATPTVYAGHEHNAPLSAVRELTIALSGPVFSLISGAVVLATTLWSRGFARLFWTWFGVLSAQNFFAYLMTGPFVPSGDIGKVLRLASAPTAAYLMVFVVGAAGTVLLGRVLTARFLALADDTLDAAGRAAQLRQLAFFAWICGAGTALILSVGSDLFSRDAVFEALGIFAAGLPATMARFFVGRLNVESLGVAGGVPWVGMGLVVILVVLRATVLTHGVRL